MKRLIAIAVAALAGAFVYRKAKESEAQKKVWSGSTDKVE
ncbi:DLW-39 family protein [Sinomonas sp. ASV486]|uniref:DLW-39 family protein n=1 Tax=Sinomonas puerhi TaxID=3238584 RepID=A0AB39L5I7_9MICC|nr:DLW-39 family protein [Sinomonas sp. ASV486]MDQ4491816.1 DLW-39 family protein [Sinomonas sp. ASV486]